MNLIYTRVKYYTGALDDAFFLTPAEHGRLIKRFEEVKKSKTAAKTMLLKYRMSQEDKEEREKRIDLTPLLWIDPGSTP